MYMFRQTNHLCLRSVLRDAILVLFSESVSSFEVATQKIGSINVVTDEIVVVSSSAAARDALNQEEEEKDIEKRGTL